MLIAGVDEAGRGCVIGPLVISGYLIKEEKIPCLLELGVKDSKKLSSKKRKSIISKIMDLSENFMTIYLSPEQIDKVVKSKRKLHKLNRLEAKTMAKIIETLQPDKTFVDAADVNEVRFKKHIQECLAVKTIIIAKHKADEIFPVVSAASILAKVNRDEKIRILREKYGDFGSGYLSDKKTRLFLKDWIKNNMEYPICVRKSWKPAKRIKNEKGTSQTLLF
ncbi:MAG: ribonuclease HII [Candidatus Bathyarchaeota archaeon]|nr:ribonuclease HII [Candidatus Bathyarchaeota archaeon]